MSFALIAALAVLAAGQAPAARDNDAARTAFARAALVVARTSDNVIDYSCQVNREPRCRDVAAFVRDIDARDFISWTVYHCPAGETRLCVFGTFRTNGSGRMKIVTDNEMITDDPRLIRVRAVCMTVVGPLTDLRSGDPC